MLFSKDYYKRSQDLKEIYFDAGQFYCGRPSAWLGKIKIFDHHSLPIFIPRWRTQDIDDNDDWLHAEKLYQLIMNS